MAVICPECNCAVDDPDTYGCLCAMKDLRDERQTEIELFMRKLSAMEKKGVKPGINGRSIALSTLGPLNRVLTSDQRREMRSDFTKKYGPKPTWRKPTAIGPKNIYSDAQVRGLPHKTPQSSR